ncbi:MAG TPA: zinc-binding dehydrogenase [Gammaproteobacteria bacterium]|nr:zinc-binding dehydrogenase [Gammaproteobacteria bacterium]
MKAAILVGQKKHLILDEIQLPSKLDYGQVLVRVICSGICGSQIGEVDGVKGPDKFLPHLLGHEGGGIVEKVGKGVSRVKKNDRVVMHWRKGFGIESATPNYKWGKTNINAGWITTFNEYAVVSENRITPIPEEIDFETAALLGCAVTTGFGVINNDAKLKIGESIVIFGVGSVGMNEIQGASLVSAYPIIAVDLYDHKLEQAKKFGATHVINAAKEVNVAAEIFKIMGKNGVDVAIDNTGNTSVIEIAYEITSTTGRTILVGVPDIQKKTSLYTLPLHFDKKLVGSHGGGCLPSVDIPNYLKLIQSSKLKLKNMITHHFSLSNINQAFEEMRTGHVGKCMIVVTNV